MPKILQRFTPARATVDEIAELVAFFGAMAFASWITLTKEHQLIEVLGIIAAGVFAQFMVRTIIRQRHADAARQQAPGGSAARDPRGGSNRWHV